MATAVKEREPGQLNPKAKLKQDFDPDEYRMTIGDHLEELRTRLFLALAGYAVVLVVCFIFGKQTISMFCGPLVKVLVKHDISPRLVTDEVGEGFMVFIRISMISAGAVAAPWILFQVWQFVAAGLYPHERKYITKYLPLSITLLVSGMLFVYFLILPWTLDFFIGFSISIDLPPVQSSAQVMQGGPQPNILQAPVIQGNPDPKTLRDGAIWINSVDQRLMIFWKGQPRQIAFNSDKLIAPEIKLETYIDLVVTMLLIFGLSFQLPLVVLTLERIGVVSVQGLKDVRRYVYLVLAIAAAVITPGGDIPTMLGLTIPLIGLYELGIWLAMFGRKRTADAA